MTWNLADLFEGVGDACPGRVAVASAGNHYTWTELEARTNQLAHHLAAHGVGAGDHVGLYLHNSNHYIEATFAAHKLRAVPINVNYRYVEDELRYLFDNADLKALVHGREYTPRIAHVANDCPLIACYVAVEDGSDCDLAAIGATEYESALAAQSAERDFGPRSPDDLYILYTGGTTGMPKGVMWRSEDFLFSTVLPLMTLGGPLPASPGEVFATAREKGGTLTTFPIAPRG